MNQAFFSLKEWKPFFSSSLEKRQREGARGIRSSSDVSDDGGKKHTNQAHSCFSFLSKIKNKRAKPL